MSTATDALKASIDMASFCTNAYLEDLEDKDLFIRPTPGSNHMAWQLGHLIKAENSMINMICPGSMPELPDGFGDAYTSETANNDGPDGFLTKDEYIEIMQQQRAATLAALATLTDRQLDEPAPENIRQYVPTVAATFALQATHWMMHSGQWVIVRRMLGHTAKF